MSDSTGSSKPRLRMENVAKRFGATEALSGVDLVVFSGEVHALTGENGAGKSTLMKILAGAHSPDEGGLWLDEEPYQPKTPAHGRRAGVAMIYQELSLAPHLSVMENILLGVEPGVGPFVRWKELRNRAKMAISRVGRPGLPLDEPVANLSPAEQQLVEIARSVAIGSRILILDEPTSSLGQEDIRALFSLVRSLKEEGQSIIYISHFLEEVFEISDRYTVLRDGKSVGTGTTETTSIPGMIDLMVGRKVEELYPRSNRESGEAILSLSDVAGNDLPRSASLTLHRGEVLGIAGLVGAGRTELLRSIFGLDPVRKGTVRVGHLDGALSPTKRWRQGVGMVSESRSREGLAMNLSIADNLTLPRLNGLFPLGLVTPGSQHRASLPWMEKTRLKCQGPGQRVGDLSGGNQQKVALARLLHADVDVLLLDEPTRGIDVGSKAQIYELIDLLATGDKAQGIEPKAILMVSSYLPELLGTCDRIAVMCRGKLHPAHRVEDVDEHRIMVEATGSGETP